MTNTTDNAPVPAHGYPRPQLRRAHWTSLNGTWDFAIDRGAAWERPTDVAWDATITVPFAPETPASGVGDTGYYSACWYRRRFDVGPLARGERVILHFGAVDEQATVWVNGELVARHEGGYTPFHADITDHIGVSGQQTVVVRAYDDPEDLTKPRGKQDWLIEPHAIWYPRTTGIWQTVWIERVPSTRIENVRFSSNLERWEVEFETAIGGDRRDDLRVRLRLSVAGSLLADDTYTVVSGEVTRRITLSDPGIDDYRNELIWAPARPTLINAEIQLLDRSGQVLDIVHSYTALRSIAIQGDRFLLNGRAYQLRLVLDQGYWPASGLTAPDDDALRRDVELAKAMGFNGVRKHQKIEDPRYLYWADRLGLLVWEEMPSAYRFTKRSIERVTRQWVEALDRDFSHPCVVALVPFNESWGVPDLPQIAEQRHYVQAMYHLTKTLDPTRPVIGNDGWESVATDIVGIHDYDDDVERIRHRYTGGEDIPNLFTRERPSGRLITVDGHPHQGQPIMLTEFGGLTVESGPETWGYAVAGDAEELKRRYTDLVQTVRTLPLLAGFCYTQFADTYQERNGLLFSDRSPKFPLEDMQAATRGPRAYSDVQLERQWRERKSPLKRPHDLTDAEVTLWEPEPKPIA